MEKNEVVSQCDLLIKKNLKNLKNLGLEIKLIPNNKPETKEEYKERFDLMKRNMSKVQSKLDTMKLGVSPRSILDSAR